MTWTKAWDNTWYSGDAKDIKRFKEATQDDIEFCPECTRGTPVSHMTGYATETKAITLQCRSSSRWYNPETDRMEGRLHCTCDYCW